MKKMHSLVFLFTMLILIPTLITAQTGQVGSIKGTVTTNDGNELPGVAVTLKSPALVIGKMTVVTGFNGNYRFVSLPPGTYELSFELEGMDMFIRRGIVINANINIDIDAVMQFKTVQEQVVVEGKAPTIDVRTVAKTNTLDLTLLSSLPARRELTSYVMMTPGMTNDGSSSSYLSSQGAGVRDNSFNMDGVQINDPAIGTKASVDFSMDVMDEVSVQTGGLSAEYGSAKGAVVNIVTKSGGNEFSGTLSGYYNDVNLMSDNTQDTILKGSFTGPKYEYEPGLTIGGPLAKDKLWFFLNVSTKQSSRYLSGFPYDKPANTVPLKNSSWLPFLKLSYQPNQNNKIVASFNYQNVINKNAWADKYQNEDTTMTYKSPGTILNLQWTRNFGTNFMANMKFGYLVSNMNWYANKQSENYWSYNTYRSWGGYGNDDINLRKRLQFDLDSTYFLDNFAGTHELKFGFQSSYGTSRLTRTPLYGPTDERGFTRIWNYYWNDQPYIALWYMGYDQKAALFNAGLFLNDSWNINKHLTLNLGLRYDYSNSILPKQGDPNDPMARGDFGYIGFPDVTWDMVVPKNKSLYSWDNLSPRIGLVYDIFADGKTILKANFSHYLQDSFTSMAFELNPVNWTGYDAYVDANNVPTYIYNTYTTGVTTKVGYTAKDGTVYNLKTPYSNEFTIGIERELFTDFSLGLTYIRKLDRNLIEDANAALLDLDKLMSGKGYDWIGYEPVQVIDPYDGKTITFMNQKGYYQTQKYIINPPDAKRDYTGFELILRKRFSKGWSLNASYVYGKSTGMVGQGFRGSEGRTDLYQNANAHVNVGGSDVLGMERRNQVKIEALVKGPLGIDLSTVFSYLSGFPMARYVESTAVGLELYATEEVRAEKMGSYKYPDLVFFDVRLAKNFRLGTKLGLMVFCDIFNLLNNNKAIEENAYSDKSSIKFQEMTRIQDPRIFRFGFKLNFN